MSSLETHLRQLAADGSVRIHLWLTKSGEYQANVSERAIGDAWTCHTAPDPIEALTTALRLRATGAPGREVVFDEPVSVAVDATTSAPAGQIDLEDAIAAASTDDFEDLL